MTAWDESRLEDKEVKQANLLSSTLPMQLPKVAKPRTTNDPEAQEIWPMTLQEAIRIGLDNSEVVRVIAFGAQGIPIGGFEPTPLEHRGRGRRRQLARCRHPPDRSTTRRSWRPRSPRPCRTSTRPSRPACSGATALSRSTTASRAARSACPGPSSRSSRQRHRDVPVGPVRSGPRPVRLLGITHNINWSYQNSSFLVYPVGLHDQPPAHA